ncbi:helix-turn-helix domain-containing protein [Actinoplanes sp. NPDC023714]|uniref:helix-turn-helix domain-containing protein n=1 Tax=Actinoplanes sp. NPDC023714 TaxID=3154322 RepID=UPI0033F8740C
MGLRFTTRASDSAWIDTVWTCAAERVTEMTSVATACWGLVFWEQDGRSFAGVTGPETRSGVAPVPEGASFVGVEFAVGTSLRTVPMARLVDSGLELPGFELAGCRFEVPGADDVEALVARLVREGVIVRDPVVGPVSQRTVERRFRAATGLTQGAVRQILRAREAATLLAGGVPAGDVVMRTGYFDEPHLARALQRYVGRTAGQLREGAGGAIALDLDQLVTS